MQHNFKKQFGQNFITDTNFLNSIVSISNITSEDNVLEIGAGMGGLTEAIAKVANKVLSYEIDRDLVDHLNNLQKKYKNLEFVYKDIMKEDENNIYNQLSSDYKIVANIPYYITGPIIMKFLQAQNKPKTMTLMVQKELAQRIIAKNATKEYGIISIIVSLFGQAKILKIVSKDMFYPKPNVDSALLHITTTEENIENLEQIIKLIKKAFQNRRKTLSNNLCDEYNLTKAQIEDILQEKFKNSKIRGEELTKEDYIMLNAILMPYHINTKIDNEQK